MENHGTFVVVLVVSLKVFKVFLELLAERPGVKGGDILFLRPDLFELIETLRTCSKRKRKTIVFSTFKSTIKFFVFLFSFLIYYSGRNLSVIIGGLHIGTSIKKFIKKQKSVFRIT